MNKRQKNMHGVSSEILSGLAALDSGQDQEQEVNQPEPKKEPKKESEKVKRSYMLTEDQIDNVLLLKMKRKAPDYSTVVGEAIDFYLKYITRRD